MKDYRAMDWIMKYGWAILAVLVVDGFLIYYKVGVFDISKLVPEKFNPELHECTQWKGDFSKCELFNPSFERIQIQQGNYGMREFVCYYGFKGEKGTDFTTAMVTFNDTCVSWHLKKQEIIQQTDFQGGIVKASEFPIICQFNSTNGTNLIFNITFDLTEFEKKNFHLDDLYLPLNLSADGYDVTCESIKEISNYCLNNLSDSEKCKCVRNGTTPLEYYFRIFAIQGNKTLEEFHAGGGQDAGLAYGIQLAGMSKRYYDQNTPDVRVEYWVSKKSEICIEAVPK